MGRAVRSRRRASAATLLPLLAVSLISVATRQKESSLFLLSLRIMTDRADPLWYAVETGDLPLVQRLLDEKADASGSNSLVIRAANNHRSDIVETLLVARASPMVGPAFFVLPRLAEKHNGILSFRPPYIRVFLGLAERTTLMLCVCFSDLMLMQTAPMMSVFLRRR